MKYVFFVAVLCIVIPHRSHAQRVAYVDQVVAIQNAADFKRAEEELKKIVQRWRDTLGMLQASYDSKYAMFRRDSARLGPDSLRIRVSELVNIQSQAGQYDRLKINNVTGGDYAAHRTRLLEPLRRHFREAVAEVARQEKIDIVLTQDKIILTPDLIDLTEKVAAKLK